jgi:hypothetical protein
MDKKMKDASKVNNSSHTSTSAGTTSGSMATIQLQCSNPYSIPCFEDFITKATECFNVEMNAKNEAYAFILSRGLLDEFFKFYEEIPSKDAHKLCIDLLATDVFIDEVLNR